jgi:hypothetical protein
MAYILDLSNNVLTCEVSSSLIFPSVAWMIGVIEDGGASHIVRNYLGLL